MNSAGWILGVLVLSLAFSFVLSGMEAGVLALSRLRVRQRMRAGDPAARVLHQYLEDPEDFLWTILVGNAFANFLALSLVGHLLYDGLHGRLWLWVPALLLIVFLLYALVDLLPKMLFRLAPNRLCLKLARPFRLVHLALTPLVALMPWLARLLLRWTGGRTFTGGLFGNRDEFRLVMQESTRDLTSEEQTMISRVLDLQNLTVGALAAPLAKVPTVTAQTPITEVFRLCENRDLGRLPVREHEGGRILGLLSLRTSLYQPSLDPRKTAGDFLQPALFLEASMRTEVALQRLRQTGQRMAIVLGPDMREIGVISLEDILRFVFGEVRL